MSPTLSSRSVRTFVLRQGRLTEGQQRSLDLHWPTYGVDIDGEKPQPVDPGFERSAPLWLEIGFGNGEALAHMASTRPDINFLGIEVHLPGVGHALGELAAGGVNNVRIIRHDALEVLEHSLPAGCVSRLMIFFPDPWHKKRHRKRRLVNPGFLQLIRRVLTDDAIIHFATDWVDYADHIVATMNPETDFERITDAARFAEIIGIRPTTRFETRGRRLGHEVTDLVYQRTTDVNADV
jgi:tRNA (guanine-N7-)-methyltransferase